MTLSIPDHTLGDTPFAACGDGTHHLFQTRPGVPSHIALQYASNLQHCANRLMLEIADGDGSEMLAWAAHYVGEMASAIVEDLNAAALTRT